MFLFERFRQAEGIVHFDDTELKTGDRFWTGRLPDSILNQISFETLWDLHPEEFSEILIHGRRVKTPRWGQAYGRDYRFSGQLAQAACIPEILQPILTWSQHAIDDRLNGMLLNWYDGSLGHYIGKHRDKTNGMVDGSPIVTLSFGETRVFRMRPWKGKDRVDFVACHGSVFIIPFTTNKRWTHEVPRSVKYQGRRVSVTIRAFV